MFAVVFLVVAAVHAVAGVPTAILPAVGGFALLGAAIAVAPPTRQYVRVDENGRDHASIFVGALVVAAATLGVFIAVGRFF